jgi:hypothetical protein
LNKYEKVQGKTIGIRNQLGSIQENSTEAEEALAINFSMLKRSNEKKVY